ncbi:MAG: phosphoribosyl-ATP diphosphatase [Alphaproteobacteria bacterium]|nr:phosphoribosyl-ATP diphosphatase [Alphaproteobacteria bacterium]NCQ88493.1 phosphoribosyl-ATP diphosphatase [Alphaproteobacteria bacterium]NCT06036.1 phosphoribosyl-ATP diphosphatase [Alphaproteobacteria bacterium]
MPKHIIDELFQIIQERKGADPESSYVASLFNKGTAKIAQKVGEEAVETAIEALQGDKEKLAAESADLLFHLMILWADQNLKPDDIMTILQSRLGSSGHDEKAARIE